MPSDDHLSFVIFSRFIDGTASAQHDEYLRRSEAKVAGPEEFNVMRRHILNLYEGVEVVHSFAEDTGQIFDCIPIEQQPSLKGASIRLPDPPEPPPSPDAASMIREEGCTESQLRDDRTDKFGHVMSCPKGTIAMRRITLEEVTRYRTLQDFLRKFPLEEEDREDRFGRGVDPTEHKYATATQTIDNLGGRSFINIWGANYCVASEPPPGQASFSQQWFTGGSPLQSVECGWVVYPRKFHPTLPVLFVFYTADGYSEKFGYNLEGPFVQTNNNFLLGGVLSSSVQGGVQYRHKIQWHLADGRWWLYLDRIEGGQAIDEAVGFYPVSVFEGGQLASNATAIAYGGEVAGTGAWPPMGSGNAPTTGVFSDDFGQVAYQRDICYFPVDGGDAQQASLATNDRSPNCFKSMLMWGTIPWNRYLWFGGPGGTHCT